jgi:hypothetical protein
MPGEDVFRKIPDDRVRLADATVFNTVAQHLRRVTLHVDCQVFRDSLPQPRTSHLPSHVRMRQLAFFFRILPSLCLRTRSLARHLSIDKRSSEFELVRSLPLIGWARKHRKRAG